MADGANREGRNLIASWQLAGERRKRAELELADARNAESDATRAIASWLAPKDAKAGECFGVWDRDRHGNEVLYTVQFSSVSAPTVTMRRR